MLNSIRFLSLISVLLGSTFTYALPAFWNLSSVNEESNHNREQINQYALELLEAQAQITDDILLRVLKRDLPENALNPEFRSFSEGDYHVSVSNSENCFFVNKTRNPFSNYDRDLYHPLHVSKVKKQVYEAIQFLSDFHIQTYGQIYSLYHPQFIEICSQHKSEIKSGDKKISYDVAAKKLTIVMEFNDYGWSDYSVISSIDLKKMWNEKELFSNDSTFVLIIKKLIGKDVSVSDVIFSKYWDILNPIGKIRSSFRTLMYTYAIAKRAQILSLIDKIKNGIQKNKSKDEDELLQALTQSEREEFLLLSEEEKINQLQSWSEELGSFKNIDEVQQSVISSVLKLTQSAGKNIELDVTMENAWVQVSNLKVIDVSVLIGQGISSGQNELIQQTVNELSDEIQADLRHTVKEKIHMKNSKVQIYLVDDVTVDVTLKYSESILSKALDRFTFSRSKD